MPKITLENGTDVEISKESYEELQKATSKDWRDAFLENSNCGDASIEKAEESGSDAIKINDCSGSTSLKKLMKYVCCFPYGGFWYTKTGLYFVTSGYGSDTKATYQHAKHFIENI